MNSLEAYLEDRERRVNDAAEADDRWMRERHGVDPVERLQRWDAWLRGCLAKTLKWPENNDAAARLIAQCSNEITVMVRQMEGRGWLLDGDALAQHVRECLAPVAVAQKAGKIGDFWPYFRASVRRYVGANAEDIQLHARRTGTDRGMQSMSALMSAIGLAAAGKVKGPSMTELITRRAGEIAEAKTLRSAATNARRAAKQGKCSVDAPTLPGL